MSEDFKEILSLLDQEITHINQQPFKSSQAYAQNHQSAARIYTQLLPLAMNFLEVVNGIRTDSNLGIDEFDGQAMNFPRRFLRQPVFTDLAVEKQSITRQIISSTFMLGLLYHLFYFQFQTRGQLNQVDLDILAAEWLPKTRVASVILRNYFKKENQGSARVLFEHYFNKTLEPLMDEGLGIKFWKRGKARFFLLNLFLTGALLGMEYDLQTDKRIPVLL